MTSPTEPTLQRSLRDRLRLASEAVSAASVALARKAGGQPLEGAGQGLSEAQLRQNLLQAARKHLSIAAQAALQAAGASGLPGLSRGRSGEDATRAAETA